MNPERPSVAVIIPNYNGAKFLKKCLTSVFEQTFLCAEVLVVDNASTDNSLALLKAEFPQVKVIQSGYNAGWGIACNLGIRNSTSEFLLMLNNDAYLEKNCVEEMVKAIQAHPRYGACASRILLWDDPSLTEVSGLVIFRDGSSCGRGRLKPADTYMRAEEVFCANDCCALFRREMFDEIGEYDPDFFIYCDETDIGWRQHYAGWKCIYTPHAVAYHAHSLSAGSYSAFKAFHVERNRIFLCFKYFPLPDLLLSFFFSMYRYGLQFYLSQTSKRGALAHYRKNNSLFSGLIILLKAHLAAFLKLPVMWKRRQAVLKKSKLTYAGYQALYKKYGISARAMASYE